MSFDSFRLSKSILKAIEKKGYSKPTPIQEKAIPPILERRDVLASAQTGTGKTAGFTLPMLQLLTLKPREGRRQIKALILTPTRELAAQVHDNIRTYSEFVDVRSAVVFGGVNINPQKGTLRNGIDVLVATPGRLLDLHSQNALSLNYVEILVLDEADRMLDMGFIRDIKRIISLMPKRRQNLLFSATFSKEIKALANGFLKQPIIVEATPENTAVEIIEQRVIRVDKSDKAALTIKIIHEGEWQQVLIFTRTKHGADRLSKKLSKRKISSAAIHGNKGQGARTRALKEFKEGKCRVLVATDIAARGLDILLLPHVINFDLPQVAEDYVHRIGRTGRAGASGEAISLVCIDELKLLYEIEKLVGKTLPIEKIVGFEPEDIPAEKKPQGQHNESRKGGGHWKKKNSKQEKYKAKHQRKSKGGNHKE